MNQKFKRVIAGLVSMIFLLSAPQAGADTHAALQTLKQPGVHAVMRHALAPGTGDPVAFTLDDCGTQRNLDGRGRAQARAIGRAIKEAGIAFDRVLTSQWCRCRETAELLDLGKPEDFPALNSFFRDRSKADGQTDALVAFLRAAPDDETMMFVTHQVNITALTGKGVASGEVFLIRLGPAGTVEVVGRYLLQS